MKKVLIIIAIISNTFVFFLECSSQTTYQKQQTLTTCENFDSFYAKFFSDKVFQLSRTSWPLNGGEMQSYNYVQYWKKSTWKVLPKPKPSRDINVERIKLNSVTYQVNEYLDINIGNAGIEYVFTLKNKIWMLTSYTKFAN